MYFTLFVSTDMTNDELWRAVLGQIELSLSKANFVTWFKNTSLLETSQGKALIGVPNGFAKEWLEKNNAPQYVTECIYRSEKAVDTQICADALQLAAVGKLDRLFLYTNDYDFVPLCRALRSLGLNINLLRIHSFSVNKSLAQECDAFDVLHPNVIHSLFLPLPEAPQPAQPGAQPDAGTDRKLAP